MGVGAKYGGIWELTEQRGDDQDTLTRIADLWGSYLNAARIGAVSIQKWQSQLDLDKALAPPPWELPELSERGHQIIDVFGRSPTHNIPLYPFSEQMIAALLEEETFKAASGAGRDQATGRYFFNPRVVIKELRAHLEKFYDEGQANIKRFNKRLPANPRINPETKDKYIDRYIGRSDPEIKAYEDLARLYLGNPKANDYLSVCRSRFLEGFGLTDHWSDARQGVEPAPIKTPKRETQPAAVAPNTPTPRKKAKPPNNTDLSRIESWRSKGEELGAKLSRKLRQGIQSLVESRDHEFHNQLINLRPSGKTARAEHILVPKSGAKPSNVNTSWYGLSTDYDTVTDEAFDFAHAYIRFDNNWTDNNTEYPNILGDLARIRSGVDAMMSQWQAKVEAHHSLRQPEVLATTVSYFAYKAAYSCKGFVEDLEALNAQSTLPGINRLTRLVDGIVNAANQPNSDDSTKQIESVLACLDPLVANRFGPDDQALCSEWLLTALGAKQSSRGKQFLAVDAGMLLHAMRSIKVLEAPDSSAIPNATARSESAKLHATEEPKTQLKRKFSTLRLDLNGAIVVGQNFSDFYEVMATDLNHARQHEDLEHKVSETLAYLCKEGLLSTEDRDELRTNHLPNLVKARQDLKVWKLTVEKLKLKPEDPKHCISALAELPTLRLAHMDHAYQILHRQITAAQKNLAGIISGTQDRDEQRIRATLECQIERLGDAPAPNLNPDGAAETIGATTRESEHPSKKPLGLVASCDWIIANMAEVHEHTRQSADLEKAEQISSDLKELLDRAEQWSATYQVLLNDELVEGIQEDSKELIKSRKVLIKLFAHSVLPPAKKQADLFEKFKTAQKAKTLKIKKSCQDNWKRFIGENFSPLPPMTPELDTGLRREHQQAQQDLTQHLEAIQSNLTAAHIEKVRQAVEPHAQLIERLNATLDHSPELQKFIRQLRVGEENLDIVTPEILAELKAKGLIKWYSVKKK